MSIAKSLCCTAEIGINIVNQLYVNKNIINFKTPESPIRVCFRVCDQPWRMLTFGCPPSCIEDRLSSSTESELHPSSLSTITGRETRKEREWCTAGQKEASVWLPFNLWLCAQYLIPRLKHGPVDFTDHNHITLSSSLWDQIYFFSWYFLWWVSFLFGHPVSKHTSYLKRIPIKKLKGREIAPFPEPYAPT